MHLSSCTMHIPKEYVLNIPGRIRIKIGILRNNFKICTELIDNLSHTPGVVMASANPYTASVLVLYDINMVSVKDIEYQINRILGKVNQIRQKNSRVIRADFRQKKVLSLNELKDSKNVLSKDFYDFNVKNHIGSIHEGENEGKWHSLSVKEIKMLLNTDNVNGLDAEKVDERLARYGLNEFQKNKRKSIISIFLSQFSGFIIKLLLAASGISALLGQVVDALTILVIIGVEAMLGTWQERKAEKSLDSLKQVSVPTARVIRDRTAVEISAGKLVPGDIVLLEAGDIVPADARLIESNNLETVEASLTGETYAVQKRSSDILPMDIPLGDRSNMAFMGTSIVRGKGKAIVVATGMNTEMGKIAGMLNEAKPEKTPLQDDLDRLAKVISWGCLGICAIITAGGIIGGHSFVQMLSTGVSLAVGAIPEGLTTVLAISLAFGAQRMARKNAIVKTLPSVEALSCTKVICTDKTGTLTKNEMTVKNIFTMQKSVEVLGEGYNKQGYFNMDGKRIDIKEHPDIKMLIISGSLCNNAALTPVGNGSFNINGDPTEAAMLVAAEKSGLDLEEFKCYTREHEIPFDSETKKMTAVCANSEGEYFAFSKGAIDIILKKCNRVLVGDIEEALDENSIQRINHANEEMADRALRVLGVAYKPLGGKPSDMDSAELEEDMVFLGLVGIMDPPRPEVKPAIKKCHEAGIKVMMITGDHKKTAGAIASSIGLLTEQGIILCGDEMEAMGEDELIEVIDNVQVFARTSPQHKLRIIKALKRKGYIVAMTGDGINDAPALKEANIGIAMGKSGTDVTKDASSIILADDNFSTVVKAVEEGRTINRNVKKFIKYVLTGNFAEVLAIFLAAVSGFPTPLVPAQILMLNLITEGIPALSLGVDPPENDIMKEPPRDPGKSIFDSKIKNRIITRGIATGLTTLGVFGGTLYLTNNLIKARTMAFVNLVSCQMLHAFECSSMGIVRNKYLLPSIAISTGIMLASIYIPVLGSIFGMLPLNLMDWAAILLSTIILSRLDDFFKDLLYFAKISRKPSFGI